MDDKVKYVIMFSLYVVQEDQLSSEFIKKTGEPVIFDSYISAYQELQKMVDSYVKTDYKACKETGMEIPPIYRASSFVRINYEGARLFFNIIKYKENE